MNAFTIAWANPLLSLADVFKCGVQVIVEFPTIVVMLASEAAAAALVMPPILLRGCLSGLSVQEESPEAATAAPIQIQSLRGRARQRGKRLQIAYRHLLKVWHHAAYQIG